MRAVVSAPAVSIAVLRDVEFDSIAISELLLFELPATTGFELVDFEYTLRGTEADSFIDSGRTIGASLVERAKLFEFGPNGLGAIC